jgi:hypothetical protein
MTRRSITLRTKQGVVGAFVLGLVESLKQASKTNRVKRNIEMFKKSIHTQ